MVIKRLILTVIVSALVTASPLARADDSAKPQSKLARGIALVPFEDALKYPIIWGQECLFNHTFFGLRIRTSPDRETIKFFYGHMENSLAFSPRNNSKVTVTAMAELRMKDGKLHGKIRRWAPDGTLLLEVPFVDGKIHGECRF